MFFAFVLFLMMPRGDWQPTRVEVRAPAASGSLTALGEDPRPGGDIVINPCCM
jgi:hypothetical protein